MRSCPNHIIVISIDAMTGPDLERARSLPAFSKLMQDCALVDCVQSAYPSLTYPCHVSMATGCWPDETGIINNEHFLPLSAKRPWYFYTDEIKRPTIFHFARQAGVSSGCVMWPCMGRGPIDWLVPEIWGETPDSGFFEPFCRAGTERFIREIWEAVGGSPHGFKQPEFDRFSFACGMEVLRRKAPKLLYLHLCQVDNAKHYFGLGSAQVDEALRRTDQLLGELLRYLDHAGIGEKTAVVLCSDHGQVPVHTASYPNVFLQKQGLLDCEGGAVTGWKAQSHSACCSAQIYAATLQAAEEVSRLFRSKDVQELLGIERVYTREEAGGSLHLDGPFTLILEGKDGVLFRDECQAPACTMPLSQAGISYRSNHGHRPDRSEAPFFLISGPGVRPGARLAQAALVDEPATVAQLCGFSMEGIQGRPLTELLL